MRRAWTLGILLSFLLSVFAFAGGAPEADSDDQSYTIATVVQVDSITWFDRMRFGVEEYGEETGHDTFLLGPAQADAIEQVRIIEDLIAQGVDAITVVPFSVEAVEQVIARARDQGIVVVVHDASGQMNADLIIEAFNHMDYGQRLMQNLAARMGETGEYATFVGNLQIERHSEWVDAAVAYQQANYPNMNLIANKIEEFDDVQTAYERALDLFREHPNLGGILGGAMTTPPGVGLAVEELGLHDQSVVVGTGLVSVTRRHLESGAIDMITLWDPAMIGRAMNEIAVRLLNGETIEDGTDLGIEGYENLRQDPDNPIRFYGSAWIGVTADNMDEHDF